MKKTFEMKLNLRLLWFVLMTLFYLPSVNAQENAEPLEVKSWEKFWNPAFVEDYAQKEIKISAKWIGVATGLMDACAASKPYNDKSWIQVGITKLGDELGAFGQYPNQKWKAFIKKSESDKFFALESGSNIELVAKANIHELKGSSLGEYLVLEIHDFKIVE